MDEKNHIQVDTARWGREYLFNFTPLLKDNEYREKETAWVDGAKVFLRQFGGFWGGKARTESDTLEFIQTAGLGKTVDDAREILELLKNKPIRYSRDRCESDFFTLTEVSTPSGELRYRCFISYYRI